MKYPKFLSDGGTIGFVAPSFGCSTEPYHTAFLNAQEKLKKLGHALDLGPNCYEGCGIGISNTPEACGRELTEYYCSEKNDVLISCGGGELMCETMDYVDFGKIGAAEPKWFMGFSDNTNMTFLLATLCDTASIYGPCAAAFGMEPWHESIIDAYQLLRGQKETVGGYPLWEKESAKDEEHPLAPYHVTEERKLYVSLPAGKNCPKPQSGTDMAAGIGLPCQSGLHSDEIGKLGNGFSDSPWQDISFAGRLIGGCMDCLVNLLGTKYDKVAEFTDRYREDGIIWFLEACDLNVMSIRRAVWQMKNAGWFAHVKGFLIGRPLAFGQEMMGLDHRSAALGLLEELGVPVILDVDLGHLPPMMPLICGSLAEVRVRGNDIRVGMKLL